MAATANAVAFEFTSDLSARLKRAVVGLRKADDNFGTLARAVFLADRPDGSKPSQSDREQMIAKTLTAIGPGKPPHLNPGQSAELSENFRNYDTFRKGLAKAAGALGLKVTMRRLVNDAGDGWRHGVAPTVTIEQAPIKEQAPKAPSSDALTNPDNADGIANAPAVTATVTEAEDLSTLLAALAGSIGLDAAATAIVAAMGPDLTAAVVQAAMGAETAETAESVAA